jgi:radical SAM protein with 4Fe4S-binding SPASM domain
MKRFLSVYMDLNNECNLRCKMCYFSREMGREPSVVMSLQLFKKIAKEVFPRSLSVNLSCAAEPLLVPNFSEYLEVAKEYSIPETLIVTNGVLLNEEIIVALVKLGLSRIDISIDAATKETYEGIRKGSDFNKLLENITLLQETKKKYGKKKPFLHVDYTLMRSTIQEFPYFLRLMKKIGADHIRANHLIPFKNLDIMEESLVYCKEETNGVLNESRAIIEKFGLVAEIPPNFNLMKKGNKQQVFNKPNCKHPFESMYIMSDGRVIPCVWFSLKEWYAGSFKSENFHEIWNGEVYERLRRQFQDQEYTRYCNNCPVYGSEPIVNYVFTERERKDILNIFSNGICE